MRVKVTLTKNFGRKRSTKQQWSPNSNTKVMKEKQNNGTRNMKNINFVPKDVQRILSSHNANRRCFAKKAVLKISQYSLENTFFGGPFVIKKEALRPATSLRNSNTSVFL